ADLLRIPGHPAVGRHLFGEVALVAALVDQVAKTPQPADHSYLNATAGSIRDARLAGSAAARSATAMRNAAAAPSVARSRGLVRSRRLRRTGPAAAAPARPTPLPL